MGVCVLSCVGLFGQEYWSGLPILSPGNLPNPGIEPGSLASAALAAGSFTTVLPGKPWSFTWSQVIVMVLHLCTH